MIWDAIRKATVCCYQTLFASVNQLIKWFIRSVVPEMSRNVARSILKVLSKSLSWSSVGNSLCSSLNVLTLPIKSSYVPISVDTGDSYVELLCN